MPYHVTYGGAEKSIRASLEALAARGHWITVVAPAPQGSVYDHTPTAETLNGVEVRYVGSRGYSFAVKRLKRVGFDVALVPAEDPKQRPLRAASKLEVPVAVLSQTPTTLPFGPGAAYEKPRAWDLLAVASAVLASSDFLATYIRRWGQLPATHVPLPGPTAPSPEQFGTARRNRPYILTINPSEIKGLPILLEAARRMPEQRFGAVLGWASDSSVQRRLTAAPNIDVLPSHPDIHVYLARSQLLLVPSLWLENVPLSITEAMLAGVPVIASETGGISEVGCGAIELAPINPLRWVRRRGRKSVPCAGPQPVESWTDAIRRSLAATDADWQDRRLRSRTVAEARLAASSETHLERALRSAAEAGKRA
jgi:glycosyltransferase involved in cell wall biosynthesis